MIGGYEWPNVIAVGFSPQPAFLLFPTPNNTYRLFAPNPQEGQSPDVFQVNYENITIRANTSNFKKQPFMLTVNSDYNQGLKPIMGNISNTTGYLFLILLKLMNRGGEKQILNL